MLLKQGSSFRFSEFELKVNARVLLRGSEEIALGSKALEVLIVLVSRAGEVVSKDELLQAVWPGSFVEENNLAQHVLALRKGFGDRADLIKTIKGRGYQFTGMVEEQSERPAHPLLTEGDVSIRHMQERTRIVIDETVFAPSLPVRSWKSRWIVLGTLSVLLVGGLCAAYRWRYPTAPPKYEQIVMADLINTTGDSAFDRSLKRAMEIDLEQSPYLAVMSDSEAEHFLTLMGRKSDEAITTVLGREICERSNRQILISGDIALVGSVYLKTLEAMDCQSGKSLAKAEARARSKDDVLRAIDTVAAQMRSKLGESSRSIQASAQPVAEVTTSSLEALRSYSVGSELAAEGKDPTEFLPYFQRSIQIDPRFAMAYEAIGATFTTENSDRVASQNYRKAFELRSKIETKESLLIEAHYYSEVTGDQVKGLETYRMWAKMYPYDWIPWLDIESEYTSLGHYPPAIEAGEHALRLAPDKSVCYTALMRAYRRQGLLAQAKSIGMEAIQRGRDTGQAHAILFEIAVWERDKDSIKRELGWGEKNPGNYYFIGDRAEAAFAAGQYREALKLTDMAYDTALREGLNETADGLLYDLVLYQLYFGRTADARATFQRIKKPNPESSETAMIWARLGSPTLAQKFIDRQEAPDAEGPGAEGPGTIDKFVEIPRLRAALSMWNDRPMDAVTALDISRPYELSSLRVPRERGEAYLKGGQPLLAATEFQKVVDHYGVDPVAPDIPLSYLGLARAFAADGNIVGSRSAYEALFAFWKDADRDLLPLLQAQAE